ncbi:FadR/GntR family transcriptional regulator [Amycolatopsis saalfeldensis]|uniref:DNA-binding transcriptional regulator, FadR family n=1 Tax=Amycolatopsis saalfeldensis TaxID=394193 RepID=A0A1H8YHJ9_9PSEU|nr:FadR/GntR family transcriptional regulator [Amycolatopsis saalfeldensis]SEP51542.1 DNA-binding transcriptional regulator, FadR family [Amycolatopsis saalfeldensis]
MPVTDVAIDKIKDMIISGELAPGDRLPKEAELAQRLGLSRSSLREAVKALCLIRVLDVRQGDGTYVTSLEPNLLLDAMTFVVDFHRDDTVLDFLAVRRILEPAATALAALHMGEEDIAELGALLDELADAPTVEALVANDLQFHRKIADGSGNPVLCSLLDSLSGPTARARIWRGLTQEGAVARTREQHTAIYEAIAAREPELARSWATVHIAGVEQWLRSTLTPAGDTAENDIAEPEEPAAAAS